MMSAEQTAVSPWWWMLLALLGVAVLMAVLRAWLAWQVAPRKRAHHADAQGDAPAASAVALPVRPTPQVQDPVTGLATRLLLEDQLAAAAMRAEARKRRLALLYIDLDGFRPLNEAFGHARGDALLREVGRRLSSMGRATDTIARVGGDEFLMLLDGDPDSASATLVADRIRHKLQQPCQVDGQDVRLSCSIGIVLYPEHGPRAKLIARADAAMMAAKRAGGNMHCFYEARMDQDAERTFDLHRDLRRAVETGAGLVLHYQPQIDARTGQVTGAEALVRWQHPERGLLSPADFIPIAERFGLITALGKWVTHEACRQVRAWLEAGLRMPVAINLSVHQLRQPDLVDQVQAALHAHEVSPALITLEVSEPAVMADAKASLRTFERLAQLGVHLAIDDLGTGYSSLSYLRKLPARQLKIDVGFVQDIDQEADARAIVRAAIQLAHALGRQVVAEGVETEAQQGLLRRWGCEQMQGYLFARPMPAAQLSQWVAGDEVPARRSGFRASLFNQGHQDHQDDQNDALDQG